MESKIYDFEKYFNLGLEYKNKIEYEKAEEFYLKALETEPCSTETIFNLASIYLLLNKPYKAIEYFQRCLKIDPDDVEAEYFLSLAYFRIKDYETGVKHFEKRLCRETAVRTQQKTYPNIMKNAKLWHGEDISNKVLYTYYEAGFGDMIMFARYIEEFKKRCKKLVIKPQVELSQLFKDNFPDADVMNYFYDEKSFNFDYHIPFLSIPYALNLKNDEIFIHHNGYLKAAQDKIDFFRQKYFDNNKFKIAIKWQGNTYYETDRVINSDAFAPLFNLPNTEIYSAQTFEGAENISKLTKYGIIDLSEDFKDFSYTAGALANIDLVVCSDTSLAHLAGAMGIPCFVLLPYNYNWRWHLDLTKCDWYDSVKLFRPDKKETWNDLMKKVIEEIQRIKY